jgi:hypothetical protein
VKEEKLEQLRKVFKTTIEQVIEDVENGFYAKRYSKEKYIKNTINKLIYEIKIRINNK